MRRLQPQRTFIDRAFRKIECRSDQLRSGTERHMDHRLLKQRLRFRKIDFGCCARSNYDGDLSPGRRLRSKFRSESRKAAATDLFMNLGQFACYGSNAFAQYSV